MYTYKWLKWQISRSVCFSAINKKLGVTMWPWCLLNTGLRTGAQPRTPCSPGGEAPPQRPATPGGPALGWSREGPPGLWESRGVRGGGGASPRGQQLSTQQAAAPEPHPSPPPSPGWASPASGLLEHCSLCLESSCLNSSPDSLLLRSSLSPHAPCKEALSCCHGLPAPSDCPI